MLKINRHLLKTGPVYTVQNRQYTVKILSLFRTDKGINCTVKILSGVHKGKWSMCDLRQLKIVK